MKLGQQLKEHWEENPEEIPANIYAQALTNFVLSARKEETYTGFVTHDFPRSVEEAQLADKALGNKKRKCGNDN